EGASSRTPQPRHSGVESDLQVVHLPQLVVHLQQAVDHGLDLLRHSIEFLVRHSCELTTDLLVQRDDAPEPPDLHESTIDLLVGGEDAFELPAHVRIAGLDVLHDCPAELGTFAIEVPPRRSNLRQAQCDLRQSLAETVAKVQLQIPQRRGCSRARVRARDMRVSLTLAMTLP